MKAFTTLILGISLLSTSALAVPVQVDEVLPAANTIHSHRIAISAGATLGQRHASVVRAHVVRDLLKKRHDMAAEAAASGTPPAPASPPPPPPPVGTKPAGPTATKPAADKAVVPVADVAAAPSTAPVAAPSEGSVEAAVGPGGPVGPGGGPGNKCTEENLLQCTINEWRDAEVCFVELCLN